MSAKYFCDQCGVELSDNNRAPGGRVIGRLGRIQFEVYTAFNNCWNGGQFCSSCVISAVASLAASEPGVKEDKPKPQVCLEACYCASCGHLMPTAHRRSIDFLPLCAACQAAPPVEPPAPASTPFDAKAWAENMVPDGEPGTGCNGRGVIRAYDFPGDDYHWNPYGERESSTPYARRYIAAALTAAHAAGRAEGDAAGYERGKAEQKPRSRWINIRRVGGENDPNARVVVEYYLDGRMIYLGEERVADNFSHGWNLSMREAQPAAGYNNNTIVCTKCGRPEGGDRDAR